MAALVGVDDAQVSEPRTAEHVVERYLAALEGGAGAGDMAALEDEFVDVARSFSRRWGISRAAWLEVGVAPAVLRRARL